MTVLHGYPPVRWYELDRVLCGGCEEAFDRSDCHIDRRGGLRCPLCRRKVRVVPSVSKNSPSPRRTAEKARVTL